MSNVIQFPTVAKFIVIASDASPDDTIFASIEVSKQSFVNINDAIECFKSLQKKHDEVELYTADYVLIETTHDFDDFEEAHQYI